MKLKLKLQVHYESELICMLEQYFMLAVCGSYSNQTLNLWGGQEKKQSFGKRRPCSAVVDCFKFL